MNLYECHLNMGVSDLDAVTPLIAAETRGQAKAILLSDADDAGFPSDWTTPVSIRLARTDDVIPETPGVLRYL